VVEGIVLLRKGENPSQVLKDFEHPPLRISTIRVLPTGVKIKSFTIAPTLVNPHDWYGDGKPDRRHVAGDLYLSVFLLDWRTTVT